MQMCRVVHVNKYPCDVYIGRHPDPIIGKWGNPYTHHAEKDTLAKYVVSTRKEAIEKYREYILFGEGKYLLNELHELKGKTLGCWCGNYTLKDKTHLRCHGQILLEILENTFPTQCKWW